MQTISVEALYKTIPSLTEKEVIIDVRTHEEYENIHMTPSLHIPLDQLDEQLESLQTYNTIYFLCRSGHRSGQACKLLSPYINASLYNVEGGLLEWEHLKLPTKNQ